MPQRSPYSRSVTAARFCLKTALGGGIAWLEWRWRDLCVAKFSGHTSHGTIKVTQILALSGHSIVLGLGIFLHPPDWLIGFIYLRDERGARGSGNFPKLAGYRSAKPRVSSPARAARHSTDNGLK